MAAGKHREIPDIQQTKKMVPLITCEASFGQHVCKLVFGADKLDLNLGVQINSVKHPSRATLQVFDTCFIVGLLPLTIILITASLFSKNVQLRFTLRRVCVCGDVIHMRRLINISVSLLFRIGFAISRTVSCCGIGW